MLIGRRSLAFYVLVSLATFALLPAAGRGQTDATLMLKPWAPEEAVEASADAAWFESGHTLKRDEKVRIGTFDAVGRVRLFPGELVSPRLGFDYALIDVADGPARLPEQLIDVSVAAGAFVGKWNDWVFGLTAGVGYAGVAPFADGNAWYGKADVGVGREIDAHTRVGIVLDYNGNRTFMPDVPLPGFAYNRQLDPRLLLTIGFPVNSLVWKPTDAWTVDLTYYVPDDFALTTTYNVTETLGVFGSYFGRRDAFVPDDGDRRDRLLFFQRRVEAGVRWQPAEPVAVTLSAGYAFDQSFDIGWDTRNTDTVADLSDEPYLRLGVTVAF